MVETYSLYRLSYINYLKQKQVALCKVDFEVLFLKFGRTEWCIKSCTDDKLMLLIVNLIKQCEYQLQANLNNDFFLLSFFICLTLY